VTDLERLVTLRHMNLHDKEVARYVEGEANVSPLPHRYVDDLRFRIRGNLGWSLETPRYAMGETS
jgi:hypothetical protein